MSTEGIALTSVRFRNFKALRTFTVSLQHMNMLVGPNNAGKSSIIGAFRVLAGALQRARTRRPEWLPSIAASGYPVAEEVIPISTENIHTDYEDVESTVEFRLSNGRTLTLRFPSNGGCFLLPDSEGRRISGPADFRREFPIAVGFVPVLGPLDDDEALVQEETVRRGLATHRASRHFRSYWYYTRSEFGLFRSQVQTTWPGMDVLPPELPPGAVRLVMFCTEDRMTRELYWAGSGFQIWCQILTYLVRSRDASLLVIDEPEIYLHPDLQRQLVTILRDAGPDILLATHSSDIIADAEPQDLLLVDKHRQSAVRMQNQGVISLALDSIGSVYNFAITQIARTKKVLFVEGEDLRLIDRFARKLGILPFGSSQELAVIPLGGFPTAERLKAVCLGVSQTLGVDCLFAGVFDRDYRSEEELLSIRLSFERELWFTAIHARKEIENYLLAPDCLDRVISAANSDRVRRGGRAAAIEEPSAAVLERITDQMKVEILSQYQSKRLAYRPNQAIDQSTLLKETTTAFEEAWCRLETRTSLVPGKQVFAQFADSVQHACGLTITPRQVIDGMRVNDIPEDLRRTILGLERFRNQNPTNGGRRSA